MSHPGAIPGGAAAGDLTNVAKSTMTRALLFCGMLAGPLFVLATVAQMVTRQGFDARVHALSLLSLGQTGWVQITNFIACGVLVMASAVGIRRAWRGGRAGTWGPILIGVYGAALVWSGIFVADPSRGFPAGVPEPATTSWHSALHAVGPAVIGLVLMAACVVFARRFASQKQRGLLTLCCAVPLVYLGGTAVAFAVSDFRVMFVAGALLWLWAALMAAMAARSKTEVS